MKTPRKKLSKAKYRKLCEYIYGRDNMRCVFCGNPTNLTPAHIIRRSQGGNDAPNNIVCACIRGIDGGKGCHDKFDQYELALPDRVRVMLESEPETL